MFCYLLIYVVTSSMVHMNIPVAMSCYGSLNQTHKSMHIWLILSYVYVCKIFRFCSLQPAYRILLFVYADFKHALVLEPQNKVASLAEKRLRKLMS